jgi:pimeloyl-ACP methyl ester carboxylesterase
VTVTADRPWFPEADADAHYALFSKERRVTADDGTPIAYTLRNPEGRQLPILLANGWSCSDAYWGKLVPALEERGHPVLVPDTRGHGMSGLPRHPGRGARNLTVDDVSMPRIARDLKAVLDDAGVDRFVVIGHSMGTQTALELYRQVPERVAAMALLAGTFENPARTFYGQSVGDVLFPIGAAVMRWLPEILSPIWMTIGPANVGHFGARLAKAAGPKCSPEDLHPYLLHLKSTDPAVMVLMAAAMRAHSAADLLPSIAAPTLIVAAGGDVFTPARCSETMHHLIPGSELVTFPDAGHTLPVEEPQAIARLLDGFLSRRVEVEPADDGGDDGEPPAAALDAGRTPAPKEPRAKRAPAKKAPAKKPAAKKRATTSTPNRTAAKERAAERPARRRATD